MQRHLHYYKGMSKWDDIKTEYITTDIGTRPLAEKHNVSYSTLRKRAERENGRRSGRSIARPRAQTVSKHSWKLTIRNIKAC